MTLLRIHESDSLRCKIKATTICVYLSVSSHTMVFLLRELSQNRYILMFFISTISTPYGRLLWNCFSWLMHSAGMVLSTTRVVKSLSVAQCWSVGLDELGRRYESPPPLHARVGGRATLVRGWVCHAHGGVSCSLPHPVHGPKKAGDRWSTVPG